MLCWTWGSSPVPRWYRGVWCKPWVDYSSGHWKLYGRHAKKGHIFIWTNACVLFHMTQLIFRNKTKTAVGNQINTVSETNKYRTRWSKFTDENACLCTQQSGSKWIEGIWCGLFVCYSFISQNFSKAGRRLFVHTKLCASNTNTLCPSSITYVTSSHCR